MFRSTLALLTSIALIGCQTVQLQPTSYQGSIEQPTSTSQIKPASYQGSIEQPTGAFQLHIEPTNKFIYKTMAFGQLSYTELNIRRAGSLLVQTAKESSEEYSYEIIAITSTNGLVKDYEIKNIKRNDGSTTTQRYKQKLLAMVESTGLITAHRKKPDYALGLDLYEGFTSRCYREELILESLLSFMMDRKQELPKSKIKLNTNSECNFLGYSYIKGRKSAIFSENIQSSIAKRGQKEFARVFITGWRAIDLEKGLVIGQSFKLWMFLNGEEVEGSGKVGSIELVHIK